MDYMIKDWGMLLENVVLLEFMSMGLRLSHSSSFMFLGETVALLIPIYVGNKVWQRGWTTFTIPV